MGSTRWRVDRGCATRSRVLLLPPMFLAARSSEPAFRHLVVLSQAAIGVTPGFPSVPNGRCLIADYPTWMIP